MIFLIITSLSLFPFSIRWVWCLHHSVFRERYSGSVHRWDCRGSDRLWISGNNTHSLLLPARWRRPGAGLCNHPHLYLLWYWTVVNTDVISTMKPTHHLLSFHLISSSRCLLFIQVYPDGIRHIRADKRVNEWKTPGKKTIVRCAVNQRQVVIALTGGELVYFEMDLVRK